ncbi:Cysteine-rich DPF motif domain-containing protein 1 [Amphibalanus amphitrite]|uniref:Cysteine-rich DPF motif domain-containing protein 1 n=1 Tax=Amphibalanus amphitrite TaxID=1232801 RepID=A0A6A4VIN2_AMPAM|nr:Cysteine-rich DPF motif domain-containing protein 1 [Amphibalanus amphitrite]
MLLSCASDTTKTPAPASADTVAEETIPFTCCVCGLSEQCHYRGTRPPFSGFVQLTEPGYVMRDPFSARAACQLPVLLGADCTLCARAVCQDAGCSVFYTRRFCLPCARERAAEFPPQLRDKLGT